MNGLGLGTNNFRIIGSAPTTERYYISDCVGYVGDFTTVDYPIGTFQLGDRVTYERYGFASFGLIDSITDRESNQLEIFSTGINTENCLDNSLYFNGYVEKSSSDISLEFYCIADNNFTSSRLSLSYYFGVYYTYNDESSTGYYDFIGQYIPTPFNLISNQNTFLTQIIHNVGVTIDFVGIDTAYSQPTFNDASSYSSNGECNYQYFMKNNGVTFNCQFDTEC